MSELAVGSLSGLAANSYVIDVASGSSLDLSNGATLPAGSILQIVRATDTTDRATTSSSFTDANISVTITPKSATSNILLLWIFSGKSSDTGRTSGGDFQISDSSDVAVDGAEKMRMRIDGSGLSSASLRLSMFLLGFVSAGSTSERTYKGRFLLSYGSSAITILNSDNTGQLLAIEVAA